MTDSATRAWDCCKLNIPYLGLFSTAIRNVLPKEGQLGEGGATQAKDSVIVISAVLLSLPLGGCVALMKTVQGNQIVYCNFILQLTQRIP